MRCVRLSVVGGRGMAAVEVDGEDGVSSGDLIRTVLSVLESHTLRGTHPLPEV